MRGSWRIQPSPPRRLRANADAGDGHGRWGCRDDHGGLGALKRREEALQVVGVVVPAVRNAVVKAFVLSHLTSVGLYQAGNQSIVNTLFHCLYDKDFVRGLVYMALQSVSLKIPQTDL